MPVEQLLGRPASVVRLENDLLQTLLKPLDTPNRNAAPAEAQQLHITQKEHYLRVYHGAGRPAVG